LRDGDRKFTEICNINVETQMEEEMAYQGAQPYVEIPVN
jgi:hypothetical protein